jgi:hypothetical protein
MEEDQRSVEDEYRALREAYRRKPQQEAPQPWRRIQLYINGLTAVGFGPGTELLLVLSHSGLGVVDCVTGRVVARDAEDRDLPDGGFPVWAPGIGPLAGQRVPLMGLWGGGLRTMAPDGWVIHRAAPNWPLECAVLCPPHAHEIEDHGDATVLLKDLDPEIRAIGFSDSGKTLVVANTELHLWNR